MKKRINRIALALLLCAALCLCAGCKSELDGEDGVLTLEQATEYIEMTSESGTIKITLAGEMTEDDTEALCESINAAASGVLVELEMSGVTLTGAESGKSVNFRQCQKLSSIALPKNLVKIRYSAFYLCTSLKSVTIPDSVTTIEYMAFFSCPLKSVSIPAGVTSIGGRAFGKCTSLATIRFGGTKTQWGEIKKDTNFSWNDDVPATVVHCTDGDVSLTE